MYSNSLDGILNDMLKVLRPDVQRFYYGDSVLKSGGHEFKWNGRAAAGRQILHADDGVCSTSGASVVITMDKEYPVRLRVVPGSHLKPRKETLDNPDWDPLWEYLEPKKPSLIIFSRGLVHSGEGYERPHDRYHLYAELMPPGICLGDLKLAPAADGHFHVVKSLTELRHLEELDKAFNLFVKNFGP